MLSHPHFSALARSTLSIHADQPTGPLEAWRHGLSYGGITPDPLPDAVVEGTRALSPRLVRIFIQEFFRINPRPGVLDWSRLDPYMDALARTGARVAAAITLKPPSLFPAVNHSIWRPNDVKEWQRIIGALVNRYSVERPLVTHWEVGNETDIGESGGSPFLIPDPGAYTEFYRMTIPAILDVFSAGRVGGPASCWVDNEPLPGFAERCRDDGIRLDFLSWHHYGDDPARHAGGVERGRTIAATFPGKPPELMVTEWSKAFEPVSVEEAAFAPRRAALTAATLLAFIDAGLDWSFYYHLWDQACKPADFQPFFSESGVENMLVHWNESPHRFGVFGVGGEVRPQYFVFQALGRMGDERLEVTPGSDPIRVLAARAQGRVSALIVNWSPDPNEHRLVTVQFSGLQPGRRRLVVRRIDADRRWDSNTLELIPTEQRNIETLDSFRCQVYAPADSVLLVVLEAT
jgi:xylan 1,4-beta-xylosidase